MVALCACCGQPLPPEGLSVDLETNTLIVGTTRIGLAPGLAVFLAALAGEAGKPLHVERLATKLWGFDNTPESYRAVLHVYTTRARKILGPLGYEIFSGRRGSDPTLALRRAQSGAAA